MQTNRAIFSKIKAISQPANVDPQDVPLQRPRGILNEPTRDVLRTSGRRPEDLQSTS